MTRTSFEHPIWEEDRDTAESERSPTLVDYLRAPLWVSLGLWAAIVAAVIALVIW